MKPIQVEAVAKSFGRRAVLTEVEMVVERGSLVGIVGENGSGKSTLLKCLVGLLRPDRGRVRVAGTVGYCPQEPLLAGALTYAETMRMFGTGYGLDPAALHRRSAELSEIYGCTRYSDILVDRLSGGTRQKVNLIAALLHDPDLLILDEPYQGFDYETYLTFWQQAELMREAGRSIVVVSHMVTEHHRFDVLLKLQNGVLMPDETQVGRV